MSVSREAVVLERNTAAGTQTGDMHPASQDTHPLPDDGQNRFKARARNWAGEAEAFAGNSLD
jgi:hypothetical protein